MKKKQIAISISLLGLAGSVCFGADAAKGETPSPLPERMNVLLILADDLGWSDTTLYGTTELYQTPHLERLAGMGMTFSRAYAPVLCSPARSSILTGQNPARIGFTAAHGHLPRAVLNPRVVGDYTEEWPALPVNSVTRLDNRLPTLGKMLKEAGYATGHFGKWHLGEPPYSPLEHGFDVDIPHWSGPGPGGKGYLAPWSPDLDWDRPGDHIEDRMAEEAVRWMEQQVAQGEPFFLNYWMFSVHGPFDAKLEWVEHYEARRDLDSSQRSAVYAAMVHSLDDAVGTLLDAVQSLSIADRTVIIFLSDDGGAMYYGVPEAGPDGEVFLAPPTSNRPLRGGKGTLWEGGIRVPLVIHWPGLTQPGTRSDALVQTIDFYPTLLGRFGIPWPEDHPVDGVDIVPALRGETFERPDGIITYFPRHVRVPDWLPPAIAIHVGNWKLIRIFFDNPDQSHRYKLFDLDADPGEENNLADRYPERVAEMDRLVDDYLAQANVVTPEPNPSFNPDLYRREVIGVQPGGLVEVRDFRAERKADGVK